MPAKKRAVRRPMILVDRDGTLIEEGNYLRDPDQVKLLPGAVTGLRRLRRAGFRVVVVSNQSGVGRGRISFVELHRVNRRFLGLLRRAGASPDGYFWCPHAPSKRCGCRKPALGMARKAARKLGISYKGAISVGDRPSDVGLGRRTGGIGILVKTGYGKQWVRHPGTHADHHCRDFRAAAAWILHHERTVRP